MRNGSPAIKEMITTNLHRLHELNLNFSYCSIGEVEEWVLRVLNDGAAPLLEMLTLRTDNCSGHPIITIPNFPQTLSSLSVHGFQIMFPNSTRLVNKSITSFETTIDAETQSAPELHDLFSGMLGSMPNLVSLEIDDLGEESLYPTTAIVSFPRLETLKYYGSAPKQNFILNSFTIPGSASLDFCFIGVSNSAELTLVHDSIELELGRRAQADPPGTTYDVRVSSSGDYGTDNMVHRTHIYALLPLPVASTATEASADRSRNEPLLVLSLEYAYYSFDYTAGDLVFPIYISRIIGMLQPQSIESISVGSNMWFNVHDRDYSGDFRADGTLKDTSDLTFLSCEGVKSLIVGGAGSAKWIAPFLSVRTNTDAESTAATKPFLAFPHLERLVLRDLNPHECVEWLDEFSLDKLMRDMMKEFYTAVEDRARAGRPLKRLEMPISETKKLEKWVEEARKMGWVDGEIVCEGLGWGGYDGTSSEEDEEGDEEE